MYNCLKLNIWIHLLTKPYCYKIAVSSVTNPKEQPATWLFSAHFTHTLFNRHCCFLCSLYYFAGIVSVQVLLVWYQDVGWVHSSVREGLYCGNSSRHPEKYSQKQNKVILFHLNWNFNIHVKCMVKLYVDKLYFYNTTDVVWHVTS